MLNKLLFPRIVFANKNNLCHYSTHFNRTTVTSLQHWTSATTIPVYNTLAAPRGPSRIIYLVLAERERERETHTFFPGNTEGVAATFPELNSRFADHYWPTVPTNNAIKDSWQSGRTHNDPRAEQRAYKTEGCHQNRPVCD